jgi:hypothetical protein
MLKRAAIAQPGSGTLVIGAPPGPENDSRLLSAIRKLQGEQISILVKKCGNYKSSASFWEQNGIKAVFVNNKPNYFYKSLFHLLSGYANIVGCTFSSAIIFAAALGKHTDLIRDYRYRSYNIDNYLEHVNFSDPDARSFVKSFLIGNQSERERRALSMLGNDYSFDKKSTQNSYINAISRIALPVHAFNNIPSPMRRMIFFFSMMLNRPGISKMNKIRFQQYIRLRRVPIIDMDELSIWKDGINERNFISTNVRYIKGITEPGFAVEQY